MTFSTDQILQIIGMIGGLFTVWSTLGSRMTKLETQQEAHKDQLQRLTDDVRWFLQKTALDATKFLHHPHPDARELDELLDLFHDAYYGGIPLDGEQIDRLRAKLWQKIADPHEDRSERLGASNMLRAVEAIYHEHRGENPVRSERT